MPLGIRPLPVNCAVDLSLDPKDGDTPVTPVGVSWTSGGSAVKLTPSANGLQCRATCDPASPPQIGDEIQVAASYGQPPNDVHDWVTFKIVDAVTPVHVTSLGLTVGEPFIP